MKRQVLTLAVAAQMAAVGAFAQTNDTTGSAGGGTMSDTFGSDWSTSLGASMFGEDGTTVRSESEIASGWATLSDEDQQMIRRDCMALEQSADANSAGSATIGTHSDAAGTGSATADASGGASLTMNVNMEQMEEICAATRGL